MSDLPANWVETTLGEIASLITKGTTPTSLGFNFQSSGIPFVKIENIKDWKINKSSIGDFISNECHDALKRSQLAEGDVLFSIAGTIGKTAVVDKDSIPANTNQAVAIIRGTSNVILPRLLMLELAFLADDFAKKNARGGAMNNISLGDIKSLTLSIPPLNEQKRITDKLNSLLARVDSCQTHLERVPQILKRFRQSVLAKAISGELTAEWRGTETTENWSYERAEDVCEKVQSGGTPREGFIDKPGIPFLKVYNIVDQKVDFHYRPQYITKDIQKGSMSKSQTKPNDVLMNIVGPPLGKVAIVPDEFPEWNVNQAITLFRPSERITSKWIYYFLCSGYSIATIVHETRGMVGQTNISLSQCRNFVFPVPSIEEQAEIVWRVEKLFAYVAKLEARYTSASEHVERLTPSLLAKAFRGELVGQEE